ncbi:MAG TPA: MDR family MFS transporter [Trueperaceae bacterium]|nr:MDR family MFS transporter [Trueperaceae bacterium]
MPRAPVLPTPPVAPQSEPAPPGRTRRPLVLAALVLAMFMAAIEGTIVATAMPSIAASLGGFALYSWVFSAFLLMQAVTTPLFGKLADLFGRKPVFVGGVVVFLIGSVLCGFAPSMLVLVGFRFVQGLGAGAVYPTVTTLAGDLYDLQERARVQGYLSSVWGVSAVVGPLVGGLIVQYAHWSWIFWLNVPFGVLAILGVTLYLHEDIAPREHAIDIAGALLFLLGVSSLMLMLTEAGQWGTARIAVLVVVGVGSLVGFFWRESRAPEPIIDLSQWRDRLIAVSNLATLASGVMMIGLITYLPTYVQGIMGRSPLVAGFTLTSMSIGWPIASVLAGRLLVRIGARASARIGGLSGLAAGGLFVFLAPRLGPLYASVASLFMGVGMGFLSTTFIVAIQSSVDWSRRGVATATNMFMRILGNATGAALLGGVLNLSLGRSIVRQGLGDRVSVDSVQNLLERGQSAVAGSDRIMALLRGSLALGLHRVYLVVAAFTLVTAVLTLALPKPQLR